MKPEFKTFQFKIDDASEDSGIIRGFASTFGNIDQGDDVVDKGAFKRTLQSNKGIFPILADHDPAKLIGWNVRAEETEKGLFVEGKINLKTQIGRDKWELSKQALDVGAQMGLSIGYMTIKAEPDRDRPSVRRLKELKLFEYSIVTFPMNTEAYVTAAKENALFDGLSKENFADKILSKAIDLGFSKDQLLEALLKKDPPRNSLDSSSIAHSLDRLLKTLKST